MLGVAGTFGLLMNGVFPENVYALHHFWSGVIFNSYAAAALLAIPALWSSGRSNHALIAFSGAAFTFVILMFVFAPVHWLEWPPAAMFLMFPVFLALFPRTSEDQATDRPGQSPAGTIPASPQEHDLSVGSN